MAQKDQIDEKRSLIYANLGHSISRNLISSSGFDVFCDCISAIPTPDASTLDPHETVEFGLSAVVINHATEALYNIPEPSRPEDFRLCGRSIDISEPLLHFSYSDSPAPRLSATTSMSGSPSTPLSVRPTSSRPYHVRWLTTISSVIKKLEAAVSTNGGAKLIQEEFFGEFVALLGLRPRSGASQHNCKLMVFRPNTPGATKRPHILSQGYPERFCGVSPFRPYGSTADNRSGKAGLPETVSLSNDLNEQIPGSSDYENIRTQLAIFADFFPGTVGDYFEAELLTYDLHNADDKPRFRKEVLRRLTPTGRNSHCPRPGSSYGICGR